MWMYPFAYGNALDTMIFLTGWFISAGIDNDRGALCHARAARVGQIGGYRSGSTMADWSSTRERNLALLFAWW